MIYELCLKICGHFINAGIITPENKDLYCYGLHQGIIVLFNILTALLIGFLFDSTLAIILYLTAYIPLRIYAGGYHAQTQQKCFFFSVILITAILLAIKYVSFHQMICCIGIIINAILITILTPVEDKNKPFTEKERVFFRERTKLLLFSEIAVFTASSLLHFTILSTCIFMAFSTVSIMLILGRVKNHTIEKSYIKKEPKTY